MKVLAHLFIFLWNLWNIFDGVYNVMNRVWIIYFTVFVVSVVVCKGPLYEQNGEYGVHMIIVLNNCFNNNRLNNCRKSALLIKTTVTTWSVINRKKSDRNTMSRYNRPTKRPLATLCYIDPCSGVLSNLLIIFLKMVWLVEITAIFLPNDFCFSRRLRSN